VLYHALIEDHNGRRLLLADVSEYTVIDQVVHPYQEGGTIFIDGEFVAATKVRRVWLKRSDTPLENLIVNFSEKIVLKMGGDYTRAILWDTAENQSDDVTRDYLTGSPEKSDATDIPAFDLAILTALNDEEDAVKRHFHVVRPRSVDRFSYSEATVFPDSVGRIALPPPTGMGNVNAAIRAGDVISSLHPKFIVLTGITAGVQKVNKGSLPQASTSDKRLLGDVVVTEQVVAYEIATQFEDSVEPRFDVYRASRTLLDTARRIKPEEWVPGITLPRPDGSGVSALPRVHFGVGASGDKIMRDLKHVERLRSSWTQLAAIEMEAYGVSAAAF
jgi:nucleoside phosphorylase